VSDDCIEQSVHWRLADHRRRRPLR